MQVDKSIDSKGLWHIAYCVHVAHKGELRGPAWRGECFKIVYLQWISRKGFVMPVCEKHRKYNTEMDSILSVIYRVCKSVTAF